MIVPIPKVSIIMPVKNAGSFLVACIESIINQSLMEWELIAVNDHSSDDTADILESFARIEKRIQVFDNVGHGIINALRLGYTHSKGKYITRMDADDIMVSTKLMALSKMLDYHGPGHLSLGLVKYFSQENLGEGYRKYEIWLNKLSLSSSNFSDIYKECSIPSPCWMIGRTDFNKSGGFSHDIYPEDYDLAFRFKKAGLKITAVGEVLHLWRDYSNRTSRTHHHYSDNRFTVIKVVHFLDSDRNSNKQLYLWGAGKKGKDIAKELIKQKVSFRWVCNNINKIGRDVYDIMLEDVRVLDDTEGGDVIVAINSVADRKNISESVALLEQHCFYRFC